MKYAIEYEVIGYSPRFSILRPLRVVKGRIGESGDTFKTTKKTYCYVTSEVYDSNRVIGNAFTMEELRAMYGALDDDDPEYTDEDIKELFLEEEIDKLTIVRDGIRTVIDLFDLFDDTCKKELYEYVDGVSGLYLNAEIFDEIESIQDPEKQRAKLLEYRDKLVNFNDNYGSKGVQSVMVKDGHVSEINFGENAKKFINFNKALPTPDISSDEFSVTGLYKYLKSYIYGHDQELKDIATILFLNYISTPEYGVESILVPGPTGTGKTETFKVAANYFNVPSKIINTVNLVSDGIVGTSVENIFASILEDAAGDVEKAAKAILIFDEFDKLALSNTDYKGDVRNILLKVLEGSVFPIVRQYREDLEYDTTMASKICLGSFSEAFRDEKRGIGFGSDKEAPKKAFDRHLLVERGYFTNELLDRINHFIVYNQITKEQKKDILLHSEISRFLLKKKRLLAQFGITICGERSFANGMIDSLDDTSQSMRDLNNRIYHLFLPMQYEILSNMGKYKTLKLSRDTVTKGKYDLS